MKKLLSIILCLIIVFSLVGCGWWVDAMDEYIEEKQSLPGNDRGKTSLIDLGGGLCYDPTTKIVYWWNHANHSETPSPYYAPNGFPYLYNPETNTFEEIER